jgi:hypothetical protein
MKIALTTLVILFALFVILALLEIARRNIEIARRNNPVSEDGDVKNSLAIVGGLTVLLMIINIAAILIIGIWGWST